MSFNRSSRSPKLDSRPSGRTITITIAVATTLHGRDRSRTSMPLEAIGEEKCKNCKDVQRTRNVSTRTDFAIVFRKRMSDLSPVGSSWLPTLAASYLARSRLYSGEIYSRNNLFSHLVIVIVVIVRRRRVTSDERCRSSTDPATPFLITSFFWHTRRCLYRAALILDKARELDENPRRVPGPLEGTSLDQRLQFVGAFRQPLRQHRPPPMIPPPLSQTLSLIGAF